MQTMNLSGKKAFVTGGSGDIGHAICVALARQGAEVAFTYFRDHTGKARLLDAMAPTGGKVHAIRANFADLTRTDQVIDAALEALGTVDLFVSNAASGVLRQSWELSAEQLQHCLDINLRPLHRVVQRLVGVKDQTPLMGPGGRIIALSSSGAQRAIPLYCGVGASKAAIEAVIRHLALELGGRGITANVVSPGIVDTKALRAFPHKSDLLEEAKRRTPVGRLATPEDVASVVAFLCSEGAAMINGQTLTVDGGYAIVG